MNSNTAIQFTLRGMLLAILVVAIQMSLIRTYAVRKTGALYRPPNLAWKHVEHGEKRADKT